MTNWKLALITVVGGAAMTLAAQANAANNGGSHGMSAAHMPSSTSNPGAQHGYSEGGNTHASQMGVTRSDGRAYDAGNNRDRDLH